MATRVTTYAPGATIMVRFTESINHDGWYRISFQPDGEEFRIPPASNGQNAAGNNSNYPTEDRTGMTDETNALVLKDRIDDNGVEVQMMVEVTLPTTECTNCTLQVMSVMNNGANYNPANGGSLYFQCADITLAANAPDAGVQVTGDAGVGSGSGGNNNGELSGGCSTGTGAGLPAALALLGFAGLRRRRR